MNYDKVKDYDNWKKNQDTLCSQLKRDLEDLMDDYQSAGLENEAIVNTIHNWADKEYNDYYHMRDWLSVN